MSTLTVPAYSARLGVIDYPDSDGEPMADNTEQFDFIATFKGNLDILVPDFVAGDHLWYPVEGRPDIRIGPDVFVALGRQKGHRGSYRQWEEGGVAPQVVFEWWSPRNDFAHQVAKLRFYERHGVLEFYTFDQTRRTFSAFVRGDAGLQPTSTEDGIASPLLGIRMAVVDGEFRAWHPDGRPFRTMSELEDERRTEVLARQQAERERERAEQERERAEQERERAEQERERAEQERERAEQERERAEQERERAAAKADALAARLRALGIDPESI